MYSLGILLWALPFVLGCAILFLSVWLWPRRAVLGKISGCLMVASIIFIGSLQEVAVILPMLLVQAWLVLVAARLAFGRLDGDFLHASTAKNTWLGLATAGVILFGVVFPESGFFYPSLLVGLSLAVAAVLVAQVWWTLTHFRVHKSGHPKTTPTVTVCIPARNEDHALDQCLRAVLASNYPKLEVLVLDDCSQDKTAQIIKTFAHDGVRFVQGDVPASGWLGKNQAMQTLTEHATGQWLLFISVDTLVGPQTVSALVNQAQSTKMQMISVLPQNRLGPSVATVFTTLQYFWQIAVPMVGSWLPVSSKLWLIHAGSLKKMGGFAGVKHKVIPEASFAKRLFTQNAYRFYLADAGLDLTTAKRWHSQIETSRRLLYPLLKRQPFFALFGLGALALLLLPFIAGPYWLLRHEPALAAANIIAAGAIWVAYGFVVWRTHPNSRLATTLILPAAIMQEAAILLVSMLSYEFSEVSWKGRNVCYPVISARAQAPAQQVRWG